MTTNELTTPQIFDELAKLVTHPGFVGKFASDVCSRKSKRLSPKQRALAVRLIDEVKNPPAPSAEFETLRDGLRALRDADGFPGKFATDITDRIEAGQMHSFSPKQAKLAERLIAEAANPAPTNPGKHLGTEGERVEWVGKVVTAREVETRFGDSILVVFEVDGSVVKTFTSGKLASMVVRGEVEIGDVIRFKATVKHHDTYQGKAQTMINRAAYVAHVCGHKPANDDGGEHLAPSAERPHDRAACERIVCVECEGEPRDEAPEEWQRHSDRLGRWATRDEAPELWNDEALFDLG